MDMCYSVLNSDIPLIKLIWKHRQWMDVAFREREELCKTVGRTV